MRTIIRFLAGAFIVSAALAALLKALSPVVSPAAALVALIPVLGAGGLLYLAAHADAKPFATLLWAVWLLTTLLLWTLGASALAMLAAQSALLWIARVLWWRRRPLASMAEALVTCFAMAAFLGVLLGTGSYWLAIWSWCLAHATSLCLHFQPAAERDIGARSSPPGESPEPTPSRRWQRAARSAETSLRRLGA